MGVAGLEGGQAHRRMEAARRAIGGGGGGGAEAHGWSESEGAEVHGPIAVGGGRQRARPIGVRGDGGEGGVWASRKRRRGRPARGGVRGPGRRTITLSIFILLEEHYFHGVVHQHSKMDLNVYC